MASIKYRQCLGEPDLPYIMALVQSELSEPYVVYTFRYFLHQWWVAVKARVIVWSQSLDIGPICRFWLVSSASMDADSWPFCRLTLAIQDPKNLSE